MIAANRERPWSEGELYSVPFFRGNQLEMENLTLGIIAVDLDLCIGSCAVCEKAGQKPLRRHSWRIRTSTSPQKNCRFVSRLNLYPVCGAGRSLYEHCHFEQTDDALNGNAVYLDCEFDFYSGMPIYQASGTGAVFLKLYISL